jgi:hypothetical protein
MKTCKSRLRQQQRQQSLNQVGSPIERVQQLSLKQMMPQKSQLQKIQTSLSRLKKLQQNIWNVISLLFSAPAAILMASVGQSKNLSILLTSSILLQSMMLQIPGLYFCQRSIGR